MSVQSLSRQVLETAGIKLVNSTELYPALHQPGDAGLPMLQVDNSLGSALIALQGAHLMSFRPAGQREMLWVSPKALLQSGKPIRGGIPLCMPWFGPSPDGKVLHGFARIMEWSVVSVELAQNGATHLALELRGDASVSALWPHAFVFRLDILVGKELKLGITVENCSNQDAPLAFAFHTYLAVADVAKARVAGLEGTTYIDKMDNSTRKTQSGEVTISAPTTRFYLDVPAQQIVNSSSGQIIIESNAKGSVVWNAWSDDKNIFDLGEGNHVGYLCVERGDFADHAVTLQPGGKYRTWMILAY